MISLAPALLFFAALNPSDDVTSAGLDRSESFCGAFVGQSVQTTSFDDLIFQLPDFQPKGEFETTEQFQHRVSKSLEGIPSPIILAKPAPTSALRYDADRQVLRVYSGAFATQYQFSGIDALFNAEMKFGTLLDYGASNVAVVMDSTEEQVGTYKGSNSFGATTTVRSYLRSKKAIFERPTPLSGIMASDLFPQANQRGIPHEERGFLGEIPMPLDEAKAKKESLRAAFVIVPKPPFLVKSEGLAQSPTVSNPREVNESYTVIIADIRCGMLIDNSGQVLVSYETF